jgi:hypothetical protein
MDVDEEKALSDPIRSNPLSSLAAAAPHGSSLVVTIVLLVTLDAFNEHRLVGPDASDLSALAGARGGTVGTTLQTRKQKD